MLTIKQNDNGIGIKATLSNEQGPVNLTDAEVLFVMGEHEIPSQIVDAENGQVLVVFESIHTEVPGIYPAEFEVRFPDGRNETFPNDDYIKIHIMKDLGGR